MHEGFSIGFVSLKSAPTLRYARFGRLKRVVQPQYFSFSDVGLHSLAAMVKRVEDGQTSSRVKRRIRICLYAMDGVSARQTAKLLHTTPRTVTR